MNTICIAVGFWWCDDEFKPYRDQIVTTEVTYQDLMKRGNFVGGSSVFSVRRLRALDAGGYPLIRGSHDWGFLLRLARTGVVETLPTPLVFYRSPTASTITNETKDYRRQLRATFKIRRDQPKENRHLMKRQVNFLICRGLALSGRRKLAGKLIALYIRNYGLDARIVTLLAINLFGPRAYSRTLVAAARIRARAHSMDAPEIAPSLET